MYIMNQWFRVTVHQGLYNQNFFFGVMKPTRMSVLYDLFDTLWPWRSCILVWITYAAGGIFLLENPQNSLIAMHPRWVWMMEQLRKHGVLVPRLEVSWSWLMCSCWFNSSRNFMSNCWWKKSCTSWGAWKVLKTTVYTKNISGTLSGTWFFPSSVCVNFWNVLHQKEDHACIQNHF